MVDVPSASELFEMATSITLGKAQEMLKVWVDRMKHFAAAGDLEMTVYFSEENRNIAQIVGRELRSKGYKVAISSSSAAVSWKNPEEVISDGFI